jgi:hypothetical protein
LHRRTFLNVVTVSGLAKSNKARLHYIFVPVRLPLLRVEARQGKSGQGHFSLLHKWYGQTAQGLRTDPQLTIDSGIDDINAAIAALLKSAGMNAEGKVLKVFDSLGVGTSLFVRKKRPADLDGTHDEPSTDNLCVDVDFKKAIKDVGFETKVVLDAQEKANGSEDSDVTSEYTPRSPEQQDAVFLDILVTLQRRRLRRSRIWCYLARLGSLQARHQIMLCWLH